MKKLDLVKLKNEKPYLKNNLKKDMHGIIIECLQNSANILFFNPKNVGDYVIVNINNEDIQIDAEKLPIKIQNEIISNLDNILSKSKSSLEKVTIEEYDTVELLIEDEKYSKYGIHKGDKGCVMDNNAIKNYIEVDFSGIDKNGNYYGDCIAVKIDDLKIIK